MGILANHVASIEQLRPGLIDIIEEGGAGSKQFFGMSSRYRRCKLVESDLDWRMLIRSVHHSVSGGFAVVQPNSELSVNAVEAYALEDFSAENVKNLLAEANKIANGSGSEQDIAEAKVEVEVSWWIGETSRIPMIGC